MVCMKNADSVVSSQSNRYTLTIGALTNYVMQSRFGSHLQSAAGVLSITSAHYSRDAR